MLEKHELLKNKMIVSISLVFLLIILVGATYAYFKAQTGSGANVPTQVTTNTTDSLVFETGTNITITADTITFAEGMDNRVGTSFAKATLKANNKTNSASGNYYVYLDITKNELTYTTKDKKPELLLKITNPNNTEETAGIEGLEYKSVIDGKGNTVSGFDITEYEGLITIVNNKEITSTSETIENWGIEVILVNLDADQTTNGGKEFIGKLLIQNESKYRLAINCQNKELGSCIANNYKLDENIYYHKNLENSAEDESYRYSGSDKNVNNYVCFGSTEEICSNENLYRIIGVFNNQVKLIKADFATEYHLGISEYSNNNYLKSMEKEYKGNLDIIPRYYWSGSMTNKVNDWGKSTLNTNALNKIFINNLDSNWTRKISTMNWIIGGLPWIKISESNAPSLYNYEIANPSIDLTLNARIGLMYASDYMYGASPEFWTKIGYSISNPESDYRTAKDYNWMYIGINEWTISRPSDYDDSAVNIFSGRVEDNHVNYHQGVRPCFYLNSDVQLISGTGTKSNPYRIS